MFSRELQTTITDETPLAVVNWLSFIMFATNSMNNFITARTLVPGMKIGSRENAFVATNTCRHG